ncbi:hypothetical protein ATN38_16165 [Rhodococcus sp. FH8]|uniref:restriction endonuclease subunit S n=1 Tax=Rhodococcus sp. FH8 TaxID=1761013 RepID=UPI001C4F98AF|nr:restriction endonuclease subunit S [Rhodococcus sp. FH8]MBW0287139.1 hypothetical protein [Rhodococcus sp. FH8]
MNWIESRVGDVAEVAIGPFGSALKADLYVADGIPMVTGGDLGKGRWPDLTDAPCIDGATASRLSRSIAVAGDLVFPHRGSIGRVGIADRSMMLSTSMMRARFDKSRVSAEFAYWFFLAEGNRDLLTMASSVGTPGIGQPLTSLRSVRIRFPHLSEQDAIAEVLGALDDKIAANGLLVNRALALGEALVRAGDLRPKPLEELATITMGTSPRGDLLNENGVGIPFFQGVRDFGEIYPTNRVFTSNPVRTAPDGAVLFAVRAPVGKINLAGSDTAIGRGLASIVSDTQPATLFFAMRTFESVWDEFQGGGTVFASINGADVKSTRLPMPTDREAPGVEVRLSGLLGRAILAERESQALNKARDELLPLLMSGKITIKDAEKQVEQEV